MPRPKKKPGELGKPTTREVGGVFRSRVRIRDGAGAFHDLEAWGTTAREAEDSIQEKANKVWSGMFVALSKVSTTEQLANLWLADVDLRPADALEQSSREAYHNRVKNNVLPYIGAVPIEALTAGFIHNLLQRLASEKSHSFASITRKTLSGMLTYAVLNGALPTSPMGDVPKLRNTQRKEKVVLDEDQILLIIGLIRDWRGRNPERKGGSIPNVRLMEDFILLMLGTSLRPSEILGLRLDDVHLLFQPAKVSVTGNIIRTKKTKLIRKDHPKHIDQERTMTVPEYTDVVLRRLVASYRPNRDELLMPTKNGTPVSVSYIDRLFREFRDQHRDLLSMVGIKVDLLVPYALRKTVASVINEEGGADLASKVLGHHDPKFTLKWYARRVTEVDPESAAILNRAFSRLVDGPQAPLPTAQGPGGP